MAERCAFGVVLTTDCRSKWEKIVPKVFIHHGDFSRIISTIIARQVKLQQMKAEGKEIDDSFALILDGISVADAGIDFDKMRGAGVTVITAPAEQFADKILFSRPAWEFSSRVANVRKR
jgi:hypothetical protein